MSCWVVPTIAAEFWGIPIQQVLDGMKTGDIASKTESGFTFVDVAPDSPVFEAPKKLTPPTYTIVTHEELVALTETEETNLDDWKRTRNEVEQVRRPPLAA
ncbi:MAG TPA: hypothetical protein VKK61_01810 [Tepidisphaeraceae bacterium]|jgi:hypothetical protein|nr:hypothetical protein [Tepidisphaeraceae bacterium]